MRFGPLPMPSLALSPGWILIPWVGGLVALCLTLGFFFRWLDKRRDIQTQLRDVQSRLGLSEERLQIAEAKRNKFEAELRTSTERLETTLQQLQTATEKASRAESDCVRAQAERDAATKLLSDTAIQLEA